MDRDRPTHPAFSRILQPLEERFAPLINGLLIGNVYALLAIGLALTFGTARLMNFAHGSVFMYGAYVGWALTQLAGWSLLPATLAAMLFCAGLGLLLERLIVRPLRGDPTGQLLGTLGVSYALDQLVQLVFSPDPQSMPDPYPALRLRVLGTSLSWLDGVILLAVMFSAFGLFWLLRRTRVGQALRAAAQHPQAAQLCGVDLNRVNALSFGLASALAGLAGVLVALQFNTVYPTLSAGAALKGFAANVLGGLGSMPGAVLGALLLGVLESMGVAVFGSVARNLFAFVLMIGVLLLRPHGLFGSASDNTQDPPTRPEPARRRLPALPVGTFRDSLQGMLRHARWLLIPLVGLALLLPPYPQQVLVQAAALGLIAVSVGLVTGMAGTLSLGHAAFVAIGAYASALLARWLDVPFVLSLPAGMLAAGVLAPLIMAPALRLRGPYAAIASLGLGEIVALILLNAEAVTGGALGVTRIPPPGLPGLPFTSPLSQLILIAAMLAAALVLLQRLRRSRSGRAMLAGADDADAAQASGVDVAHMQRMAFGISGALAGAAGAFLAHSYSFLDPFTFTSGTSLQALAAAMLGGLSQPLFAPLGALLLTALPELLRPLADVRYVVFGVLLVVLVRLRR